MANRQSTATGVIRRSDDFSIGAEVARPAEGNWSLVD
jgi:hypothetical protein